ncbi:16S rRNA (adenine(1518)-N(6)/adenine(1519)-N(6))-dimethyltransferase RsmA [Polyangium aurulentum]|uniref:16S rRNA (adenine(1518)-N(6)/adenine(1519)-N(6))- dimethyltransferase RsmA n=1 Tax=Polyangium aurulentum TaxID=2567896 RepID=UPI0010ADF097|nr:16S rRNA (adenine(1518)-N(6)/adenine(1519)-N(6))-dimethyltransferase RsmA [Polyangium aurulentum]UQA55900.1 16S rRNA (adenine(1518)-N(6)/adenine(1519)-N(6))-dimethyltransferase RsmA [Polyangium aurulentum]
MSIAERLRSRGLSPKKRFGQNFLLDPGTCRAIAEAATTPAGGTVLEIGPGLGALTRPLLDRAQRVVAIERDRDLVPILREELAEPIEAGRVEIIENDAMHVDWMAALEGGPEPRTIAGNLPYQITGALLERAVGLASRIDRAVFMVQAEVAERLLAPPGSKTYGVLTVFTQAAFEVRRVLSVKAGAFYPRPEVDSAVVLLVPHRPARAEETEAFREAVRAAFGARRKTLRNAWRGLYGLSLEALEARAAEAGISLDARGETLSVEQFARFAAPGRGA